MAANAFIAVHGTAEPAFAVRLCGEIVAWNEGAERLLGYTSEQALGERCFRILEGRDGFGNAYCISGCPLAVMVRRQEAMARFEVIYRGADGNDVPATVTPVVVPPDDDGESVLMHLLQPRLLREMTPGDEDELGRAPRDLVHRLTPREIEVLRLLATGLGTRAIVKRLGISKATVRNHVENLLRKLGVHSRLQAVALARRSGLL